MILDRFRLDGRVAVVTGASSGLGVSFARALAQAGADLVLAARRVERLERLAGELRDMGRSVVARQADVAEPQDCEDVAAAAVSELGRLDVLINNAGLGTAVPAVKESPEDFRRVVDVNLHGSYWMAQSCARQMHDGGSIVNVSSVLASRTCGMPQAAYSASKAGVEGLTRDLAQQWTGRKGIRVNALAPGFFASEMTDEYPPGFLEEQHARTLLGRAGEHEELAAAAVFLASPAASYVSGQVVTVDGGYTIA